METKSVLFEFERETKGAIRYREINPDTEEVVTIQNGASVGTIYIRKSALNGEVPMFLRMVLDGSGDASFKGLDR
jgi:hypothetical protein|tara:strand:+ start:1393 stop:1617 length:225 start_codon:yes stop_codon:yes gene_type:complete